MGAIADQPSPRLRLTGGYAEVGRQTRTVHEITVYVFTVIVKRHCHRCVNGTDSKNARALLNSRFRRALAIIKQLQKLV